MLSPTLTLTLTLAPKLIPRAKNTILSAGHPDRRCTIEPVFNDEHKTLNYYKQIRFYCKIKMINRAAGASWEQGFTDCLGPASSPAAP